MTTPPNGTPGFRAGVNFPSPVTRVLAFGYYDGPTHGVLQCGEGGPVYKFHLLAGPFSTADDLGDLSVFGLACLPPTALAQLVQAYERYWPPRWPVWVPSWQFPTNADMEATNHLTDQLLGQAGPIEFVMATCNLMDDIRAAQPVTPLDMARVSDWLVFLGLPIASPAPRS